MPTTRNTEENKRMKVGVLAITMAFLIAVCLPLGAMAGTAPDQDNDTVPDAADNCLVIPNGAAEAPNNQCDTDGDGYGNACDFDINQDNVIGGPDFGCFTANFGGSGHPTVACDSNCDGTVGGPDFGLFTATFGTSVGPSGLSCAGTTPCP
jgi:hypothetical protein